MARTTNREQLDCEDRLFEEAFLLLAQTQMQRLLNEKQLRYRDLSNRMGVSVARISQMFGDEAANLTIRTVARIFHHLGEEPVIMSRREFERAIAGYDTSLSATDTEWTMIATDVGRFAVTRANVVETGDSPVEPRSTRSSEWLEAEPQLSKAG